MLSIAALRRTGTIWIVPLPEGNATDDAYPSYGGGATSARTDEISIERLEAPQIRPSYEYQPGSDVTNMI